MNLFKASIVCEECGEIHAERWLTSTNRHATNTTLFILCDACKENELEVSLLEAYKEMAEKGLDPVNPPHKEDCACITCMDVDPFKEEIV